jgi:transposase
MRRPPLSDPAELHPCPAASQASLHKTGCRWRDVPPDYGPLAAVYSRYNSWFQREPWQRLFEKAAAG